MSNAMYALQREKTLAMARKKWRHDCNFRAEIRGGPADMEFFIHDISYGKGSIETKKLAIAHGEVALPDKRIASSVTCVCYDDENGTFSDYISSLQKKIFNPDGTANLPVDFLVKLTLYRRRSDASEYKEVEWDVYVEENNNYSGSFAKRTERGTFSVTFQKFASIGQPLP